MPNACLKRIKNFVAYTDVYRTHRERKEAYINSLEAEVVQLKANEARILQERKSLYSEISSLKALLHSNGITLPPRIDNIHSESHSSSLDQSAGGGASSFSNGDQEQWTLVCSDKEGRERKSKNRRRRIYIQTAPRREGLSSAGNTANSTMDSSRKRFTDSLLSTLTHIQHCPIL